MYRKTDRRKGNINRSREKKTTEKKREEVFLRDNLSLVNALSMEARLTQP